LISFLIFAMKQNSQGVVGEIAHVGHVGKFSNFVAMHVQKVFILLFVVLCDREQSEGKRKKWRVK
jgi:hypothetical protein